MGVRAIHSRSRVLARTVVGRCEEGLGLHELTCAVSSRSMARGKNKPAEFVRCGGCARLLRIEDTRSHVLSGVKAGHIHREFHPDEPPVTVRCPTCGHYTIWTYRQIIET